MLWVFETDRIRMTPLTPLRKHVIAMEAGTVLVALPLYFGSDPSDQFAVVFYYNGLVCLLIGFLATSVLGMPSWGLAGFVARALRWGEGGRLAIVALAWLLIPLVYAGNPVFDLSLAFILVSLAYGIPLLVVDSLYPDKAPGEARSPSWEE